MRNSQPSTNDRSEKLRRMRERIGAHGTTAEAWEPKQVPVKLEQVASTTQGIIAAYARDTSLIPGIDPRCPDPEIMAGYLEAAKRDCTDPLKIAALRQVSIGTVPHPVLPGKRLATLVFARSIDLPVSLRGRVISLADVFLPDEKLFELEEHEDWKINPSASSWLISDTETHGWESRMWTFGALAPGIQYFNWHAANTQAICDTWWLPIWLGFDYESAWVDIFRCLPGSPREKARILNLSKAGLVFRSGPTNLGAEADYWGGIKVGGAESTRAESILIKDRHADFTVPTDILNGLLLRTSVRG